MNNPALFFDDNLKYVEFPFLNAEYLSTYISFREGRGISIDKYGQKFNIPINRSDFTLSAEILPGKQRIYGIEAMYSGIIRVYPSLGVNDIYSIALDRLIGDLNFPTNHGDRYNIQSLSEFLNQFPNLYSYRINYYAYNVNEAKATIKGDIALVPKKLKKIHLRNIDLKSVTTNLFCNINMFPSDSELEYFFHEGFYAVAGNSLNIYGDLKYLPPLLNYFDVRKVLSTAIITYSGGKVFPASFNKFYLNKILITAEIDLLLNDMASSITTAIGEKIIYLRGTRTSASDSAVTYLQGLGFTVTITA